MGLAKQKISRASYLAKNLTYSDRFLFVFFTTKEAARKEKKGKEIKDEDKVIKINEKGV